MPDDHPMTTQIFRFTLYTCPGALIAIAFPILNTRLIIGEVLIYYVQHLLIVLIPLYLMALEGAFIPESTSNPAWPIFSMSIIILYHFLFLQPISLLTSVNLNCIICPAVSDPFAGRFYRICAICHQCVVVPLIVKLYNYSSQMIAVVIDIYAQKPKTM
ncbi:hypothetical protein M3Y98_01061000 [Aphelenchoides besseyi]|nr:hypothetical protein M3Y98_01061000 [Aphelenchoides besseyi]